MRKVVFIIISIVISLSFCGCNYNFGSHFDFGATRGKSTQTGESSVSGTGISEIEVDVGVGAVNISKSSGSNIEIEYKKEVKGSSEDIEEISDSISVDTECIGDKITVRVDAKDDDVDDFWQWLSNKYESINVTVDLDIKVPNNIKIFTVKSGVGDITIEELKGKLSAISGVGRIKINNFTLMGECEIASGTGEIVIDCDITEAESLNAKSGVGSIDVRIHKDSQFSLDATTGVGSIKGNIIEPNKDAFVGDTLVQDINGGGMKIKLTTGTGNITVDKK